MYIPDYTHARGLTLVEILIVLLVAALIVGTATPAYLYLVDKSRNTKTIDEISEMQRRVDRFERKNNRYPDSLTEIYPTPPSDPWGNPYQYLNIREATTPGFRTDNNLNRLNADYDLYSLGADALSIAPIGASQSRDDIIRADNGDFVGIVLDYR